MYCESLQCILHQCNLLRFNRALCIVNQGGGDFGVEDVEVLIEHYVL